MCCIFFGGCYIFPSFTFDNFTCNLLRFLLALNGNAHYIKWVICERPKYIYLGPYIWYPLSSRCKHQILNHIATSIYYNFRSIPEAVSAHGGIWRANLIIFFKSWIQFSILSFLLKFNFKILDSWILNQYFNKSFPFLLEFRWTYPN